MALEKITEQQMNEHGVCAAPDILNGTPAENKGIFDRMVRQLVAPAFNACVDAVKEVETAQEEIDVNEQARNEAEQERVDRENARVEAEEQRDTAEKTRAEAESARRTNEATRGTQETQRATAEQARVNAEAARKTAEEGRATAEALRVTSENTRAAVEQGRAAAESGRATEEAARVLAENARETSEAGRKRAEEERAARENARIAAENARETSEEGRKSAEKQREAAEQARMDSTSGIVAQATAQAEAAAQSEENAAASASKAEAAAARADKPTMTRIAIGADDWNNDGGVLFAIVTVEGILADETAQMITVAPAPNSRAAAVEAGMYCSAQGENALTFRCDTAPSADVEFVVSWQSANYAAPLITFTINGNGYMNVGTADAPNYGEAEFTAEEGMSWAEWIGSDYNTIAEDLYINSYGYVGETTDSYQIGALGTDKIVDGGEYWCGYT